MGLRSLEKELAGIERQFKNFKVAGTSDVIVAGNLRSGLTVNIKPRGGAGTGTPPAGCSSTLELTFPSLDFCPNCFPYFTADSIMFSDTSVAGSYMLANFSPPGISEGDCYWYNFDSGPLFHDDHWFNGDCSGAPDVSNDSNAFIVVGHFSGTFYVLCWQEFSGGPGVTKALLLYGVGASVSAALSANESACSSVDGISLSNILLDFIFGDGTPGSGDTDFTGIASNT